VGPLDPPPASGRPHHGSLLEDIPPVDLYQYLFGRIGHSLEGGLMFWNIKKIFQISWALMKGFGVTLKYYFTPAHTYQFPKEKT